MKKNTIKYYSQFGQDKFLDQKIFKGKENGIFVEIGADDGITNSNTYFFEKFRNWSGICVEPRKKSFTNLIINRNAICENCCISDVITNKKLKFLEITGEEEQLSGLLEKYDKRHLDRVKKVIGENNVLKNTIDINCDNLNNLTDRHNIKHIDYCSIDTEGGELDILKSIDFSKISIDIISVENNFNSKEFENFLIKKGYVKIESIVIDDIYVKKNTHYYYYVYTLDYLRKIFNSKIYKLKKEIKKYIPQKIWNFLKKIIPKNEK